MLGEIVSIPRMRRERRDIRQKFAGVVDSLKRVSAPFYDQPLIRERPAVSPAAAPEPVEPIGKKSIISPGVSELQEEFSQPTRRSLISNLIRGIPALLDKRRSPKIADYVYPLSSDPASYDISEGIPGWFSEHQPLHSEPLAEDPWI